MKNTIFFLAASALLASMPLTAAAQEGIRLQEQQLNNAENTPCPVFPVPSERQVKWNETEFYAFYHYGMNTYTNAEWGDGSEANSKFNPTAAPNPKQWLEAAKKAGMKGGIAVVKHHDGFCLWPTKTTDHHVGNSGTQYGSTTNIPRDFAKAAVELDMKYGFYVSPWDLNSPYWGKKDEKGNYTDEYAKKVFFEQCAELAEFGKDQFEMWFDGATGGDHKGYYGGANEYRTIDNAQTYYDIPNLRDSIHNLCPDIILWGVGGEARWIGNEQGWAGETNWAMGSGEYGSETGWQWNSGESDAKATSKGWFWHSGETISSADVLFKMYLETVGRNATLILNIPPDKSGSLPEATVARMEELGKMMEQRLGTDLAPAAAIEVTETRTAGQTVDYKAGNMTDGNKDTYWATNDGTTSATITFRWDEPQTLRYVMLMEYIRLGQRIKAFTVETSEDGENFTRRCGSIATTTVGYKRILPLNGSTASSYGAGYKAKALRITINDSKACPLLHTVSIF